MTEPEVYRPSFWQIIKWWWDCEASANGSGCCCAHCCTYCRQDWLDSAYVCAGENVRAQGLARKVNNVKVTKKSR